LPHVLPHPGTFNLFAVDYIIDENLDIYFSDLVPYPTFEPSTSSLSWIVKAYEDLMNIEMAILYEKWTMLDSLVNNSVYSWIYDGRNRDRDLTFIAPECRY